MENIYKPILFSTPMVQAILDGSKTQTRRIVKDELLQNPNADDDLDFILLTVSHKIKTGDILWVRETWRYSDDLEKPYDYKADFDLEYNQEYLDFIKGSWKPSIHMFKDACRIFLKVKSVKIERLQEISESDIYEEGVQIPVNEKGHAFYNLGKENSAYSFLPEYYKKTGTNNITSKEIAFAFWAELWCNVNNLASWNSNPFVWVYEFERIEKPLDFI